MTATVSAAWELSRDARALTLRLPWPHLIAHGNAAGERKDVENRSWSPWVSRLLIHAGKAWDRDHGETWNGEPAVSAFVAVADVKLVCHVHETPGVGLRGHWFEPVPDGTPIGSRKLRCRDCPPGTVWPCPPRLEHARPETTIRCGCNPRWARLGQVHWRLSDVRPLATPVLYGPGQQGLWQPPRPVVKAIADQLTL